jgi:hypothetical protein
MFKPPLKECSRKGVSDLQKNPNYSVLDICLLFFLRDLRMNLPRTKRMMATMCPAK